MKAVGKFIINPRKFIFCQFNEFPYIGIVTFLTVINDPKHILSAFCHIRHISQIVAYIIFCFSTRKSVIYANHTIRFTMCQCLGMIRNGFFITRYSLFGYIITICLVCNKSCLSY